MDTKQASATRTPTSLYSLAAKLRCLAEHPLASETESGLGFALLLESLAEEARELGQTLEYFFDSLATLTSPACTI